MYVERYLIFYHGIRKLQKRGVGIFIVKPACNIQNVLPPIRKIYSSRGVSNKRSVLVSEIVVIVKCHAWLLECGKMNSHNNTIASSVFSSVVEHLFLRMNAIFTVSCVSVTKILFNLNRAQHLKVSEILTFL
ncbi:hypothetical protein VNO80_16519 [Phaseolus coccineus]|uniref:Uncharacterized protein n=1 Tax=Phaseolus coccineus TaxID=3886 RepID=A0AAN9MM62_PHACN